MNMRPEISPWEIIWKVAPPTEYCVYAVRPTITYPMLEIDEYATMRFRSVCAIAKSAPYITLTTPTTASGTANAAATSGSIVKLNRKRA